MWVTSDLNWSRFITKAIKNALIAVSNLSHKLFLAVCLCESVSARDADPSPGTEDFCFDFFFKFLCLVLRDPVAEVDVKMDHSVVKMALLWKFIDQGKPETVANLEDRTKKVTFSCWFK